MSNIRKYMIWLNELTERKDYVQLILECGNPNPQQKFKYEALLEFYTVDYNVTRATFLEQLRSGLHGNSCETNDSTSSEELENSESSESDSNVTSE